MGGDLNARKEFACISQAEIWRPLGDFWDFMKKKYTHLDDISHIFRAIWKSCRNC